jgi:hypothetical protein
MSKIAHVLVVASALPLATGCAGSGAGLGALSITGNENGGTIPSSVGAAASSQSSAFQMVTAYCAKFGKRGFITKMNFESGAMIFECRLQKTKA